MNASLFAGSVSMSAVSLAVIVSRKRRRMRARQFSNASRYTYPRHLTPHRVVSIPKKARHLTPESPHNSPLTTASDSRFRARKIITGVAVRKVSAYDFFRFVSCPLVRRCQAQKNRQGLRAGGFLSAEARVKLTLQEPQALPHLQPPSSTASNARGRRSRGP